MKLTLTHRVQPPSESVLVLIEANLEHRDAKRLQRKTRLHITNTTRRS